MRCIALVRCVVLPNDVVRGFCAVPGPPDTAPACIINAAKHSGGKDSCFAMMEAVRMGHEVCIRFWAPYAYNNSHDQIAALANLLPASDHVQDLDSYMYQTVGHGVVDAYAAAMGLPLYRRRIHGTCKTDALVYGGALDGDEVEDMAALLAYVQLQHPDVQAVTSGAIASDYQRTRVEHVRCFCVTPWVVGMLCFTILQVCVCLGLVSLSPLWHRPQAALLRLMVEAGIDAVLIKVAALGLDPAKHLGKSIAQLQPHLHNLARCVDCHYFCVRYLVSVTLVD